MSSVILVPTCDRYLPLAEMTCRMIDRFWPGHVPVRLCGARRASNYPMIATTSDPRDWIGILREAVDQLQAEGIDHVYLILDDHPPVAPCNAAYLNQLLPAAAERLKAAYVGLGGWDQWSPWKGVDMGRDGLYWRRMPADFRWKYSLHPAYWLLAALKAVLDQLGGMTPRPVTARDFEACTGKPDFAVRPEWADGVYRIAGSRYAVGRSFLQQRWKRSLFVCGLHAARKILGMAGRESLERFDESMQYLTHYQNGPYPIFWSGLMQRGSPHGNALKFLRATGQEELADQLQEIFSQQEPA